MTVLRWATKIDAGHETDGGPRRAYLVYEMDSEIQLPCLVDAIDEEYAGIRALHDRYPGTRVTEPVLEVKVKTYTSMLKKYGQ